MEVWLANAVKLRWLIDAGRPTVYVYGVSPPARKLIEPEGLKGEGPVAGFVPELAEIWHSIFDDRQNLRATLAGSGATAADSAMDAQAVAAAEIH